VDSLDVAVEHLIKLVDDGALGAFGLVDMCKLWNGRGGLVDCPHQKRPSIDVITATLVIRQSRTTELGRCRTLRNQSAVTIVVDPPAGPITVPTRRTDRRSRAAREC
jgi:hypothetical protein